MIRAVTLSALAGAAIGSGVLGLVSLSSGHPDGFHGCVGRGEWGDPMEGEYKSVGFSAVRGILNAYVYLQVPANRQSQEAYIAWRSFRLGQHRLVMSPSVCLTVIELATPFWIPMVVFAVYPTITCVRPRLLRRLRRRRNLCVSCGYNLTGLLRLRCPECGSHIEEPVRFGANVATVRGM